MPLHATCTTGPSSGGASILLLVAIGAADLAPCTSDARHDSSSPASAVNVLDARVTPDGAWVVFAASSGDPADVELYRVPADGGSAPVRIGGPLLASDGYRWA